ncbi:DUF445 domain-containing protein [Rhodohalobacter mucosus]|uniref:DUF445 domain-containing protein n=1 Tax=Rhodohalobacter mucosus TaxID=2079485 RepID=A0A316TTX7_9BACT|nr:DUF445 family protein [Rhodohalobacter mucosus]PWN07091.1 DUF445 domain-containing protein [Rhodohalobacter mucosus]
MDEDKTKTEKDVSPAAGESGIGRLSRLISSAIDDRADENEETKPFIPPPSQPKLKILTYLKPLPWILCAFFGFSFLWDFEGYSLSLFRWTFPLEGIIRIVSVSGLIGYLTNWIAITMLFRPLSKRPLLGQGLIPAQKERIAYRLSLAVSEDLINPDIIKKKIESSDAVRKYRRKAAIDLRKIFRQTEFREEVKEWVVDYISFFLENESVKKQISFEIADEIEQRLEKNPIERTAVKTYTLLKGKQLHELIESTLDEIPFSVRRKIGFVDELLDELPGVISESSEELDDAITAILFNLVNRFDVQQIVEENLSRYDEMKLERMIMNATNEQLKTIQYLGALLGTIGGLVIWQPVLSLIVLGTAGISVYTADRMLYQ